MVTIQLMDATCKANNGSYMSCFTDFNAQNSYFVSHIAISYQGINWTGINKPIMIPDTIDNLMMYDYGRMQLSNNGKWYYFSINNFETVTENKTLMSYNIDAWETFRYNGKLKLGRGQIIRSSILNNNLISRYPINSKSKRYIEYDYIQEYNPKGEYHSNNYDLVVIWHDSTTNVDYVTVRHTSFVNDLLDLPVVLDSIENWYPNFTYTNCVGIWLSPFTFNIDTNKGWYYNTSVGADYYATCELHNLNYYNIKDSNQTKTFNLLPVDSIVNKRKYQIGITDMLNNLIWVADKDSDWDTSFIIDLHIGLDGVSWVGYCTKNSIKVKEGMFTIPCEQLSFYNDTFHDYNILQRPFIEEQRRIQREQSLTNTLSHTGESMIIGGLGNNPLLSAFSGALNIASGYIDRYASDQYDKERQYTEDKEQLVATDELRVVQSGYIDYLKGYTYPMVVRIYADQESNNVHQMIESTYGYYYNVYDNVENWIIADKRLTAIAEIEGIPTSYANTIYNRLANGVIFYNG